MAPRTNKASVSGLSEIKRLTAAIQAGNLSERGKTDGISAEWAEAVKCFNKVLDAYATPLSSVAGYAKTMASGAIPEKLPVNLAGDFGLLTNNLNASVDQLNELITELNHMSAEHDRGDIDVVIDAGKFNNDFAKVANGINTMVNGHIAVKKKAMACIAEFGRGNFEAALEKFPGKKAFINETIEQMRSNLKALMAELNHMSAEHDRGDIDVVIDAGKFENDFAKVAIGINTMVNGHIAVKKKAMACIAEFGRGNFESQLEKFPGKKAFINETIEQVRANLKALVADADMLAVAAVEGRLQIRADAAKHQGDYRRIVEGVNNTLDSVIGPVNNIARAIQSLGRNDMSVQLEGEYRGDFAAVKNSFEDALTGINNTLFQIVDAVEQVGQSADQLSAASQNMASTSEEQASAVEEVTSSLTQTDSQVKANTENANAANQLVIGTSQAATQGQAKMEAMTESMNAINAASQNIGKIIKVIDEIAFQTNLLALNAAVEAARAGQHGRGFAVVAQEVRNLAGRSAKAARETSDMIEDSVKRVSEGVNIARETREALNLIVTNVVKVKDFVAEIATASTEQSRGVSQISIAMGQVGKSAQAGSQQSEELASSSGELANIAARMRDEVRRFKLRERKSNGLPANFPGMEGLTTEMVAQLKAMLAAQAQPSSTAKPALQDSRKSAKALMPLDQDERGYGSF